MLERFGTLREAWYANQDELLAAGLGARACANLRDVRRRVNLDAELARLDKLGIAVLTWEDEDYPALLAELRDIDQAPPLIYLRGSLSDSDEWAITVVGTRSVSPYGRQVTYQLAHELAANGLTIISGLARGVDIEAHQAALEAGKRTIAILPCGLDTIYPPEHRNLAARIVQQGALMSSFSLGTVPKGTNFAPRNRMMSGLGRGVLVTEAGIKSGALVTAGHALEQGREVFAVPGNITAQGSSGTNRLIQDGAHPVLAVEDILEVLKLEGIAQFEEARASLPSLGGDEEIVLRNLSAEPLHIDELTRQCGLPISCVTSMLTLLELKGMVRQVGRMTYVRL
ncbi:MAG: DNA-processing protein DprA [Anaerolineae bacterium]|nr:DNA-processing protein DprA [Anaerolineae bacterium]